MLMGFVLHLILALLCAHPMHFLVHSLVLSGCSGRIDAITTSTVATSRNIIALPSVCYESLQLKRSIAGRPLASSSTTCLLAYPSHMQSYSFTTSQMMGSMSQETLPNILGVNPVEGAIIFGVLYYIYGPTTLYEYAREAVRRFMRALHGHLF